MKVTSTDGTQIAYDKTGSGPALIIVNGAFGYRNNGNTRELSKLLADHFTVYDYDRRGRGESTDTMPYSVDREIDDLSALCGLWTMRSHGVTPARKIYAKRNSSMS